MYGLMAVVFGLMLVGLGLMGRTAFTSKREGERTARIYMTSLAPVFMIATFVASAAGAEQKFVTALALSSIGAAFGAVCMWNELNLRSRGIVPRYLINYTFR